MVHDVLAERRCAQHARGVAAAGVLMHVS
jgi:hypothetical protein